MKLVMLDNYDSFTYNIVQYLQMLGAEVVTIRNNRTTPEEVLGLGADALVLSPGPGKPSEAGILTDLIQAGARAVSRPVPVPVPEPDCAPVAEEPASGEAAAEEDVSGNPSASRSGEMPRSSEEPCREQRLEDLSGAPMPKAQKAVLATALLLIVGFAAYYFFFMR